MNDEMTMEKAPSQEKPLAARGGMALLLLNLAGIALSVAVFVFGVILLEGGSHGLGGVLLGTGIFYWCVPMLLLFAGLKVIRPNEAMVLTLFGRYIGTLKGEGFYFVNPFATAMPVPAARLGAEGLAPEQTQVTVKSAEQQIQLTARGTRRLSLKTMTMANGKQKINDKLGNPINIGIVVIWRVADTAKAMFDVDNYVEYLSIQCDSALRSIVRLYPYDAAGSEDANEKSLRGSSQEISGKLCEAIQEKVGVAGLQVMEARITHLAYAPEIAAAMLQRQQASAIVDARQLIVEGAVGMVEMALEKLNAKSIVTLDEERKAAMVSNLMVVLCGNRDAQPIVNSGSLY